MLANESNNSQIGSLCDNQETQQEAHTKSKPTPKSKIGLLFWVAVAILGAVVAFHFLGRVSISGNGFGIAPAVVKEEGPSPDEVDALRKKRQVELEQQKLELEKKKFAADVELRIQKYKGDVAETVERYRKMLPLSEAEASPPQQDR